MSENYTAWDGVDYPWPPPEGWVIGSDGRYWPDGQQPVEAPTPTDQPSAVDAPMAAPPPFDAPQASMPPAGDPAPGATPPPQGMAPPGAPGSVPPHQAHRLPHPHVQHAPGTYTYGTEPAKSSKTGWWILGMLVLLLTLGLGSCVLVARAIQDGASELNSLDADVSRRDEAAQAINVSSCTLVDGVPTAGGTVTNPLDSASSYFVQVEFFSTESGDLIGKADVSILDIAPGASETFEVAASASGIESAIKCARGSESVRIDD